MTAKEMFERLGYERLGRDIVKYRSNDGGYIQEIIFFEIGRRVVFREWEEYNNNEPQGQFTMYIDLLQAINQQVKELGWIESEVG